jgi:hypothetical protein
VTTPGAARWSAALRNDADRARDSEEFATLVTILGQLEAGDVAGTVKMLESRIKTLQQRNFDER